MSILVPFGYKYGLKLGEINVKTHFNARIKIPREILHKTYCLYKFDSDFIPKMPISSHFEQITR